MLSFFFAERVIVVFESWVESIEVDGDVLGVGLIFKGELGVELVMGMFGGFRWFFFLSENDTVVFAF
jgi:hypothetical protein